jgi:hypothetical protein
MMPNDIGGDEIQRLKARMGRLRMLVLPSEPETSTLLSNM